MNATPDLSSLQIELNSLKEDYKRKMLAIFGDFFNAVFSVTPSLNEFSWRQYTPYWCDGEPCEFRVSEYSLELNGESYEDYKSPNPQHAKEQIEILEIALGNLERGKQAAVASEDYAHAEEIKNSIIAGKKQIAEYKKILEEHGENAVSLEEAGKVLYKFLANTDSDIMKDAFGDHVTVIVTRNQISTEHYDHD